MRAKDLQKLMGAAQDAVASTFDHLGDRFADAAEDLGDDLEPLRDWAKSWSKMGKAARRTFVEQFLKSAALVTASAAATRAGLGLALKNQKQLRKVLLSAADWVTPVQKQAKKGKKKLAKKLKKLKK